MPAAASAACLSTSCAAALVSHAADAPVASQPPRRPVHRRYPHLLLAASMSQTAADAPKVRTLVTAPTDDTVEPTGRSVFERLGSRPAAVGAAAGDSRAPSSDATSAAAVTEDEDGEMTGSTSDEELVPVAASTPAATGRILSLRGVVGSGSNSLGSRSAASRRSGRSPIVYDEAADPVSGYASRQTGGRPDGRVPRHSSYGYYADDEAVSSVVLDRRRHVSDCSSTHQYDRQRSPSLTPPHLRDSNGLKYDRHGNPRRTTTSVSSHSHPHYDAAARSAGTWRRSSPESHAYRSGNGYSMDSPSAASKGEKYRQKYFDDYRRKSERPGRESVVVTDSSTPAEVSSGCIASESQNQATDATRSRVVVVNKRNHEARLDDEISSKVSNSSADRPRMQPKRSSVRSLDSAKEAEAVAEAEEGEELSDWSPAESGGEEADEDLDSISSTDELLAHILSSSQQNQSSEAAAGDSEQLKMQEAERTEQQSACEPPAEDLTESWQRLFHKEPAQADGKEHEKTSCCLRRGEAGAARLLQSTGFSSRLAGQQLTRQLNHFICSHCVNGCDAEHQLAAS